MSTTPTPELIRIPRTGERDPVFQQSRHFYYQAERDGRLKLQRLRRPGATRGLTVVSVHSVRALLERELTGAKNQIYVGEVGK